MSPFRKRTPDQHGFTLMEVSIAAGVLFVLLTFLAQMLLNSTEVFDAGERGQELAQRTQGAVAPVEEALGDLTGPTQIADGVSDARLLLQWMPLGKGGTGTTVQVLRSTVRMSKADEAAMFESQLMADAEAEGKDQDQQVVRQILQRMIREIGPKGRADMMLLPWPQGDAERAYLKLLRCRRIPYRPLPFNEAKGKSLLQIEQPGGDECPPKRLPGLCDEIVARGLLHIEYQLWSQYTEDWKSLDPETAPEWVWDSARVGWLLGGTTPQLRFTLDLGSQSAVDASDDVYPRKIRLTIVIGNRADDAPEAMLSRAIGNNEQRIPLTTTDGLPDKVFGNFVKIGSEWVRFKRISGRTLMGCERGHRGTRPKDHERGTGVRVGRTVIKTLGLTFGRDSWNG